MSECAGACVWQKVSQITGHGTSPVILGIIVYLADMDIRTGDHASQHTVQRKFLMEENFDEFDEMLQIRQNFPHQSSRD